MANTMSTPLERMYPTRCFDCLAPCERDKVLCGRCESSYRIVRERRQSTTQGQ